MGDKSLGKTPRTHNFFNLPDEGLGMTMVRLFAELNKTVEESY